MTTFKTISFEIKFLNFPSLLVKKQTGLVFNKILTLIITCQGLLA